MYLNTYGITLLGDGYVINGNEQVPSESNNNAIHSQIKRHVTGPNIPSFGMDNSCLDGEVVSRQSNHQLLAMLISIFYLSGKPVGVLLHHREDFLPC